MNQNSKDMKRHYFITYMIIMMAILSACYSDNSEEASVEVGNISISGIKEKYSAMSDNGEVLQINPLSKVTIPKKTWNTIGSYMKNRKKMHLQIMMETITKKSLSVKMRICPILSIWG